MCPLNLWSATGAVGDVGVVGVPPVAGGVVPVVSVPPPVPGGVVVPGVVGVVGVVVFAGVVGVFEVDVLAVVTSLPPPHAATSADAAISEIIFFFWNMDSSSRMSGNEMPQVHAFH
jgi:hypothetical protein